MFDGQIKPKTDIPEVELHGPSETYAACLKALRQNQEFVPKHNSKTGPEGLTEMAMFLDVFSTTNA